jgi:ribosomal protein S18 acetylase RimI-like enzyme
MRERLTVQKVDSPELRAKALGVLRRVYATEKGWVETPEQVLPFRDLEQQSVAWFMACLDSRPVGVTRVLFEIPQDLYRQYELKVVQPGIDIEAFLRANRLAEIGRFAVLPEHRHNVRIAAILMRAATTATVERGCTHFITDVLEADANSPLEFHQRILGFQVVATHDHGELPIDSRRITLLLDLKEAFQRLRVGRNWIYRFITHGWNERLLRQLSA